MESEVPRTIVNPSFAALSSLKKFRWFGLGLVILLLLSFLIYRYLSHKPSSLPLTEQLVAKVGQESLYYKDLLAFANADHFSMLSKEDLQNPEGSPSALIQFYLDSLINQSVILQEGQKEKKLTLDKNFFNSEPKDYQQRLNYLSQVKKSFDSQVETVDLEAIVLYTDGAPGLVSTRMQQVKTRLDSGQTMENVAKTLSVDPQLVTLNNMNKKPYRKLTAINQDQFPFGDKQLIDKVFSSQPNTLSAVMPINTMIRNYPKVEFTNKQTAFIIFKVLDHHQASYHSFNDWLAQIRKQYSVERFL